MPVGSKGAHGDSGPSGPSGRSGHRIGLDIARVIAVGLVVVSHYVSGLQFIGVFGVELFFALSGYLIGRVLYQNLSPENDWSMTEVKNFWVRRWWRTLPNYYLFLVVFAVFHAFSGGLPKLSQFPDYLFFFQNLLQTPEGFYSVSWSLAIEEWFYLLFPLTIFAFTKTGLSRRKAVMWTIGLFLVVPPLLRLFALQMASAVDVRQMTLPRLDAIFYGVAITFMVSRFEPGRRVRAALLMSSLVILAFFFYRFARNEVSEDVYTVAYVMLPLAFAMSLPWLEDMKPLSAAMRPLSTAISRISAWSFSIYLSHMPILFTVYWLADDLRDSTLGNLVSKVVAFVICIVLSRLVFEKFEKPLTGLRPAQTSGRSAGRHSRAPSSKPDRDYLPVR